MSLEKLWRSKGGIIKTLIKKLAEQGHVNTEWNVSRFLNGKTDKPDGTLIMTLSDLEICMNPATAQPYSFRELMLIACEQIDPKTGMLVDD